MADILYLISWLLVVAVSFYASFRLMKSALVYFFGTNYNVRVRNLDGSYTIVRKRLRSREELDAWVMDNYSNKEGC